MENDIKSVAEKALRLSSPARAYIAELLLESLDYEEDFFISEVWIKEIKKRCQEIDSGIVRLIPGEEVFDRIREKYWH